MVLLLSKHRLGVGLVLAGLATVSAAGCLVASFALVSAESAGGSGPGGSGPGGAGGRGGGACEHESWPPPPDADDPGANDVDFVVAGRRFDFGETDVTEGPKVGFDLDNRCTCDGDGDSCKEPSYATADHCDGPGGRDNAVAQLFAVLGQADEDFTSAHYTKRAEQGKNTFLIRVRDYNGAANDTQVTMSLHPSPGLDGDPCGSSTAAWDGNDAWPVSATSLLGGAGGASAGGGGGSGGAGGGPQCNPPGWDVDAARYVDTQAYVSNWWLVANLPEIALEFVADNDAVPVQLTAGFVVGRIENASGRWRMRDAVVAGRWRLAEFFRMLGTITNAGEPICTDTSVYLLLKSAVCQYPDIASALGGPTTPCDSLSAAIGFDADPAQMGTVYTNFAVQPLCPPATDPQYDGCD